MKAPVRWLEDPDALPDDLVASMAAYRELGPSQGELAQLRVRLQARPSLGLWKLVPVLGVIVGAALWWPREAPRRVERVIERATPVVEVAPAPVARGFAPPVEAARELVPVVPRRVKPRLAVAAKESAPASDPAAELALLQRARRALAVAPATSLALTEEHASAYPLGAFAQERELIAIEALTQTDRVAAIARARAFAAKYPSSAHRERIEVLLGER